MLTECRFKEIKIFKFQSEGVKNNHENMVKSNDGIPSHHGNENEGTCFLL